VTAIGNNNRSSRGNKKTQRGANTTKKSSSGNSAKRTKSKIDNNIKVSESKIQREVIFLAALAASVLSMFSLFGLCGKIGEYIKIFILGTFGIVGYIVPAAVFLIVIFFLANKKNSKKLFAIIAMMFILCGVIQLITGGALPLDTKISEYYFLSSKGLALGGIIGGIWVKLLVPILGIIGTFLVMLVPTIICIVIITEKSVVNYVGRRSEEFYEYAKEDVDRRKKLHSVKKEERKRYRLENKVAGVAANNIVTDDSVNALQDDKEANDNINEDMFVAKIHMPQAPEPISEDSEDYYDDYSGEHEKDCLESNDNEDVYNGNINGINNYSELEIDNTEDNNNFEDNGTLDTDINNDYEIYNTKVENVSIDNSEADIEEYGEAGVELKQIQTLSGKVINVEAELPDAYPLKKSTLEPVRTASTEDSTVKVAPPKPKIKINYKLPPIDLLVRGDIVSKNSEQKLRETAVKLQQTLKNFGVGVTVTDISCGPTVTRYELQPEQGVKVSKIVALSDDIKLNLAVADIRIEAPIPGKAAVGIEVPNKENQIVRFRDILESELYKKHVSRLCFGVGKDIAGQVIVSDIAKMPHVLIAGATGSGKSVCINTLIMSILYKAKPDEVKLIMVDPKVVELSIYNGIPHLMIPVVTDPKKAAGAINWAVAEMSDRYKKFAEYNVRDLKGYNDKVMTIKDIDDPNKPEKLPQIVIIIDELADLMMVAPGEVEESICRLAQLARAAGIHLVIATQRPSVNVITGLIKANVPSRVAFAVSSGVDSRTILDMNGAEKLLGKGDMLFAPYGSSKPVRVQGAFISDEEVGKVVEFWSKQGVDESERQDMEVKINMTLPAVEAENGNTLNDRDEYFEQAALFIMEKEKASIGMFQRNFKIGFNRAARIMDQLYEAGIVGEEEGTKPRKILVSMEEWEQFREECL